MNSRSLWVSLSECLRVSKFSLVLLAVWFWVGCAPRSVVPYTSREAVDALNVQRAKVKTVRGRAWVSAKRGDRSLSFPALVAADFTDEQHPKIRIEGIDPLGSTHALMIMNETGVLRVVDFDSRKVTTYSHSWNGIPLKYFAPALFGMIVLPTSGSVETARTDGFDVRDHGSKFSYAIARIDPGARFALAGFGFEGEGHVFNAEYSKFLDHSDFYLPSDIKFKGAEHDRSIEVRVAWRERTWNGNASDIKEVKPLEPRLFELPEAVIKEFAQ